MWLEFSHIIAFGVLFVSSLFDVFSEKGDVPSVFMLAGVFAGFILHAGYAWFVSGFTGFQWFLGVGLVFSLFGWISYLMGLWGGADALALTVLGFAAPFSVSGPGPLFGLSLFINILLVSTSYIVLYILYTFITSQDFRKSFYSRVKDNRVLVSGYLFVVTFLSFSKGSFLYSISFFLVLSLLSMFYLLIFDLQETVFKKTVDLGEVEEGDVVDLEDYDIDRESHLNIIGESLNYLNQVFPFSFSNYFVDGVGRSKVVGVTEEEIKQLKEKQVSQVSVLQGLRLVPVFPAALVLTEAGLTISEIVNLLIIITL